MMRTANANNSSPQVFCTIVFSKKQVKQSSTNLAVFLSRFTDM